jgi:hypothetical protein
MQRNLEHHALSNCIFANVYQKSIQISSTSVQDHEAIFTPPHATFCPLAPLVERFWLDASAATKGSDTEADGLIGWGRGVFFRSSRTFCDRSVFLMNHPAYRLPTVDSAMCTMSYRGVR